MLDRRAGEIAARLVARFTHSDSGDLGLQVQKFVETMCSSHGQLSRQSVRVLLS